MSDASDVQRYIDDLDEPDREILADLRSRIVRRYPEVTPHLRYRMPHFKLDGKPFVGFQATKKHLALYVWSDNVLTELDDQLDGYDTGESTIRFTGEDPLSAALLAAVLDARAGEIRA